jgi:membrane protease subunit HflK
MTDDMARIGRDDRLEPEALLNQEGPWGEEPEEGEGGRPNPWTRPGARRPRLPGGGQPSIEELIRRSRARFGGGGGSGPARPIWGYALGGFVTLWLATTSIHQIDPQERGVVTRFGRYAGTLTPGIGLTLPAPADVVTRVNVDQIQSFDVPENGGQNLVLTGDQNMVDLGYSVRWSVRDPELFEFEFARPEDTIREVAESAMREEISRVTLEQAIGPMRSQIEARVASRAQAILDRYRSGVAIQGVAIKQADPPSAVSDAFKDVSAAQQQSQAYLNTAHAYAEQTEATAQAAAAAFDKVYDTYRLAPEVTRRRMYYETMEAVLAKTNKVIVPANGTAPYLPMPIPPPRARPAEPAPAPAAGNAR